jgi:hypothetical protein
MGPQLGAVAHDDHVGVPRPDRSRIEFFAASHAHVGRIANRMREIDQAECAAFGRSPKQALRLGLIGSSFAVTAMLDGSPHAMFGVTPANSLEGIGRPWFLGSDAVLSCARPLLEIGPGVIALMHRRFGRLENLVSVRNERAIRLLKRWGFIVEADALPINGEAMLPFWRVNDV